MPLSWNEIRDRAFQFSKRWADAHDESSHGKPFWIDFFEIFGITDKRVATFEHAVRKFGGGRGRADLFWRGKLLVEQKSRGKDLDAAYDQAMAYLDGMPERDLPRYVAVCDFELVRLHDLSKRTSTEFPVARLRDHIKHFGFVAGYEPQPIEPQSPVNRQAAEQMGRLHDLLKASGYGGDTDQGRGGHPLQVLLVRLLFCLFADDTGIFQPAQAFRDWLQERTAEDGSDLGPQLALLFQVLNTQEGRRSKVLDEQIAAFPFVNGRLFEEPLPLASFTREMRETLLDCCRLDWGTISPAIFGALFQSIMDEKARRNLGAHYTSEENILKLIKPLFLDELWEEFGRIKGNRNRLLEFHQRLRRLNFLDPACGCGNFLVIAYRELRKLELELMRAVRALADTGSRNLFDANLHQQISIDVDQFYGIEIEEFPAQIAQVALWLVDHQMNTRISEEFGLYFARIPLRSTPHIACVNALHVDWNDVLPAQRCSYVLGNPPFVGAMVMSDAQRQDMAAVFADLKGYGVLDYVSCWYWKAAKYMDGQSIRAAFVSTSSVTQGEQVGLLWAPLMQRHGLHITFAHRTFRWSNEAQGVAAVHCVILGFAHSPPTPRRLFEYERIDGDAHEVAAFNINAYLVDAPDVFLVNRSSPICGVPAMRYGSMPRDDGNLILSPEERDAALAQEPELAPFIKLFLGAHELLNNGKRYCLWLINAPPPLVARSAFLRDRLGKVRAFRLASKAASTRRFAETPGLFCQIAQPVGRYVLVPRHSSETRRFIPMAFLGQENIVADSCLSVEDASLYHFGVLSSSVHNAWVRYTCGRLESRYRYSKDIVYNNFPWPESPTDAQRMKIEAAAQGILDARAAFPAASLADLYDPLSMPSALLKAHQALDAAVDAAYGRKGFKSDAERVAFLFELYQKYTSLLPAPAASTPRPRSARRRAG